MNRIAITIAALAVSLLGFAGCSTPQGTGWGGPGATPGGNPNGTCEPSYYWGYSCELTCVMSSCGDELDACMGERWACGDMSGGKCGEYNTCVKKCAGLKGTALGNCVKGCEAYGKACNQCWQAFSTCTKTAGCGECNK
jgi:hypothetical protein